MGKKRVLFGLSPLLAVLLSSCGITSAKYADSVLGYAVTRGRLVEVKNLDSAGRRQLADGVAVVVSGEDCEVTMQFGDRSQVIKLVPKSVIVYGGKHDYILQPYPGSASESPEGPTLTDRNVKPEE